VSLQGKQLAKRGNEEHEQELYILARFKQCASILDFMIRTEVTDVMETCA
jgi:hypothetical protein